MSIVAVAMDQRGRTVIGSDSQLTSDVRNYLSDAKYWPVGEWMVGYVGSPQLTRFRPKRVASPESFAAAWVKWWREHGVGEGTGEWMLARRGEFCSVTINGGVIRYSTPYAAIGTGEAAALGAMHALSARLEPADLIVLGGLRAAMTHADGCGGDTYTDSL